MHEARTQLVGFRYIRNDGLAAIDIFSDKKCHPFVEVLRDGFGFVLYQN